MNTEAQIQALAAHAAPLRDLDDDDPAKQPLAGIVDEINRLRAVQEKESRDAPSAEPVVEPTTAVEGADAEPAEQPKRRGRPRKDAE